MNARTASWCLSRWRALVFLTLLILAAYPSPALALQELIAVGADAGGGPHVKVYRTSGMPFPHLLASFFAYTAAFGGGVRVAVGDVTGDGVDDLVTGAGPGGGPHVRVFDGAQLLLGNPVEVAGFFAFEASFTGGIFVAVGEFSAANAAREVIVGTDAGVEGRVRIFGIGGGTGTQIAGPLGNFVPFPGFPGGVRVVAGNLNGVGLDELVVGAGPGGGPHVKVFNGDNGALLNSFFAYDGAFAGGVYVAVGNADPADITDEVITGAGAGGGPHVQVFNVSPGVQSVFASFFCYDSGFAGGVRVGWVAQFDGVMCSPGPGYVSLLQYNQSPYPSVGEDGGAFDLFGVIVFPNFTGGFFAAGNNK